MVESLRRVAPPPEPLFVAVTAVDDLKEPAAYRDAGVEAILHRPIRRSRLLLALGECVATEQPPLSTSPPTETGEEYFVPARILVAEDNAVNQQLVVHMLGRTGWDVDLAATGMEAVHAVASTRYDLILMDCQMPAMDGFEATRAIRAQESLTASSSSGASSGLPIIALTANAMTGDRERCLTAGMDDYLSKPFTQEDLLSIVNRWLSERQEEARTRVS